MRISFRSALFLPASLFVGVFAFCYNAKAQGTSGTIQGVVKDQTGAIVAGAKIEISNKVSGYHQQTTSGSGGEYRFSNLPFTPYRIQVTAPTFSPYSKDVDVHSGIPVVLDVPLTPGTANTTVTVESGEAKDLIEPDATSLHTDIDRGLFDRVPIESASSGLSSLVTLASPGAVADSNGLVHGIGDHAENSYSVDGQPITDQTSKIFSNQLPVDSIQSLEVIGGAPPAEYGDKTSLVVKVTTRSGLGQTKPTGSITASYGSFGTSTGGFSLAAGNAKFGNFISVSGLNSGRFLDPPEFQVMHAKGNEQNIFDRVDLQFRDADSVHLNGGFTRSWFQTPNSFDSQALGQDQRSQIRTYNFAPSWTHLFSQNTLFTLGAFWRHDAFNYYPSKNPLSDLTETASQNRTLTNVGLRSDLSYVKGIHNLKVGTVFQHTLLREQFALGLTDPTVNDPCITPNASGNFAAAGDHTINDPVNCAAAGFEPNVAANPDATVPFVPLLGCFDLTRTPAPGDRCPIPSAGLFGFRGRADIKEFAGYIQDSITKGPWAFNLGMRFDVYRGLSRAWQPEPRAGVAYNIKRTNTVLRLSYARLLETPFNENLIVASAVNDPVLSALFGQSSAAPVPAGQRNEFHAGFQQAFGKFMVIDADYIWKYTHNGYDFSDLLNTPIFFPIAWHNSKITGPVARVNIPNFHNFTAFVVVGSVSARFFNPQVGGLGSSLPTGVFRIDHDQKFQETTHVQYQPWKRGPWFGVNWRYDSGLVAGRVPFAADTTTPLDLTILTADQQIQAGLFCGNQFPTLTSPLVTCAPSQFGSTRINIPAPGTTNADQNPQRIKPRNLFDVSVGHDNIFHGDRYKWSVRVTAVNLTNKVALYNFLSTFSGTHFVTPRSLSLDVGFHF